MSQNLAKAVKAKMTLELLVKATELKINVVVTASGFLTVNFNQTAAKGKMLPCRDFAA